MAIDNRLPSYESFLEFQEVYLRAIALSWKDERFRDLLLEDAGKALQEYFGYKSPWNININVARPEESNQRWYPSTEECPGHWKLPKNRFIYGVPPKPEIDEDEMAIALAAYNDSGPGYLFTCC
ncbi:hypothetical protein DSLASN_28910 [Desulfoluna limicola]|uniref:Uncharacterized protein n=1 Tax=Desulfoluna limicola TaxID=2810562 RepID=A0ABN6F539_9BACT|nr:BMA_0021/BMA_0022 family TOMM bacteriocin [Desulfoluna limicola]BCS97259.1 hypothetical protein DSLASN_28910 [Desulfoluna limicola]